MIIIDLIFLRYVSNDIFENLIKNNIKEIIKKKENNFFTKNTIKKIKNEIINLILGSRLCIKDFFGKYLPNDMFFFIKFIYLCNLKNSKFYQ